MFVEWHRTAAQPYEQRTPCQCVVTTSVSDEEGTHCLRCQATDVSIISPYYCQAAGRCALRGRPQVLELKVLADWRR